MSEEKPLLHSTDVALLDAAAGKTGGLVELTPNLLETIQQGLKERTQDIDERFPKLVEECPYETRLAVAAWVFKAIVDHATDGGSFRHLIYGRLGFESDAYVPLYMAGGMTISNDFDLSAPDGQTSGAEQSHKGE